MESKQILLELLKEKYQYELERRRYYDDGLNVPVTILTLVIGGTYTLLTNDSVKPYSFSSMCVICIISLALVALFYLWRTYFGYNRRYGSFPDSAAMVKHYRGLEKYYACADRAVTDESVDRQIMEDLENDLIVYYEEINTINIAVNDLRAGALFEAKKYVGISLLLAVLLFLVEYTRLLT